MAARVKAITLSPTITLPGLPDNWDTPMTAGDMPQPQTSDIAPEFMDLESSPTTQWVSRGRHVNIFSDDMEIDMFDVEPEVSQQAGDAALGISSNDSGEGKVDSPHVLASSTGAVRMSDGVLVIQANVEALAGAWGSSSESDDEQDEGIGQARIAAGADVTNNPASVPVLQGDVEGLAGAWGSSSESDDDQDEGIGPARIANAGADVTNDPASAPVFQGDVEGLAGAWGSSSESDDDADDGIEPAFTANAGDLVADITNDHASAPVLQGDVEGLAGAWGSSSESDDDADDGIELAFTLMQVTSLPTSPMTTHLRRSSRAMLKVSPVPGDHQVSPMMTPMLRLSAAYGSPWVSRMH
jgi:hypothetical protein